MSGRDRRRLGQRHPGQCLVRFAQRRLAAVTATGEMGLEQDEIVAVERAERVAGDEGIEWLVAHVARPTTSRSRSRPSRIRVLTVPSGCLSRSAISVCVSPA